MIRDYGENFFKALLGTKVLLTLFRATFVTDFTWSILECSASYVLSVTLTVHMKILTHH